jgi:hypothetical protein
MIQSDEQPMVFTSSLAWVSRKARAAEPRHFSIRVLAFQRVGLFTTIASF